MPIDLDEAQLLASERVLRAAGYSTAWVLLPNNVTETIFLVPPGELDWVAPFESAQMRETCRALNDELPYHKVYLGPWRAGLPVEQLY